MHEDHVDTIAKWHHYHFLVKVKPYWEKCGTSNDKPLYQGQTLSVICMGLGWLWFQHCPSCLHVLATQASDLCRGLGGLGRTVCLKHIRTKSDIGSAGVTLSLLSPGTISLD